MKKRLLVLPILASIFLISCKKDAKSEMVIPPTESSSSVETYVETDPKDSTEFVNTVTRNKEGQEFQLVINNKNNEATVYFKGDSIKLQEKPAASGILYANDEYELRGKGEQIELKKGDQVVFTNE